eukprot:3709802-Heterocapsa_arctica.AAC.1
MGKLNLTWLCCDRAVESDECPGDERPCVAYYERPAQAEVQGASAVPHPSSRSAEQKQLLY